MNKIFVGGLPSETSEMELVVFISIYAHVATIKIVRDKITKKSKGYAFLEMTNEAEALKAIEALDGLTFKGNGLTVKLAETEPAKPTSYTRVTKPQAGKRPRKS